MSKAPKTRSAAVLTINDADQMTKKGRRAIAEWLRSRADDVEQFGDKLAPVFRARYMYSPAK